MENVRHRAVAIAYLADSELSGTEYVGEYDGDEALGEIAGQCIASVVRLHGASVLLADGFRVELTFARAYEYDAASPDNG